ncbi:MAG: Bro-N domain-containing protein [Ktedonobacterales bacterium]
MTIIEEQADASIRRVWEDGQWYFSVIDVIGVLTDSDAPRKYWTAMKARIQTEGFREVSTNCRQLRLKAPDGKHRLTDVADLETMLRIIQSVPSPKAEPIKQWLAKVGATRLQEVPKVVPVASASHEITELRQQRPDDDAPAVAWADYHAAMSTLYRRQGAYEAQLLYVEAKLTEHDEQIGELHSRMESNESLLRMVPELLERLGPQTLTPEHQATVKALAGRLHDIAGYAFATIYSDLNQAFHVGKYSDIRESEWFQVEHWFTTRINAAKKRQP